MPVTLIFAILLASTAHAERSKGTDSPEVVCQQSLEGLAEKLAKNDFKANRGLDSYVFHTGSLLEEILKSAGPGFHWLDAGAGEARALIEFLKQGQGRKQFATALSIQRPAKFEMPGGDPNIRDNFSYIDGHALEDLPKESVKPAHLITDIYGPISYSPHFSLVFEKYQSMLKPGGSLIFILEPGFNYIEINGTRVPLEKWLKEQLRGTKAKVETHRREFRLWERYEVTVFQIPQLPLNFKIPVIEISHLKVSSPPSRLFRISQIAP